MMQLPANSKVLVFFAVAFFSGCVTLGMDFPASKNHVQMSSYSFVPPAGQVWDLQRNDSQEYAILTRRSEPIVWQIRIYKNPVRSDVLVAATAQEIADDFRKLGIVVMTEEGVNKGKYQLSEVKTGEEIVRERKFYTMEHIIISQSLIQKVSTYLYFPQPSNNRYFFVAHYFETTPPNVVAKSYKQDFLNLLASLNFK